MPGLLRKNLSEDVENLSLALVVMYFMAEKKLYVDTFIEEYQKAWDDDLPYKYLGYNSLEEYLNTISGLEIHRERGTIRKRVNISSSLWIINF